jgi:hypothetical protein
VIRWLPILPRPPPLVKWVQTFEARLVERRASLFNPCVTDRIGRDIPILSPA